MKNVPQRRRRQGQGQGFSMFGSGVMWGSYYCCRWYIILCCCWRHYAMGFNIVKNHHRAISITTTTTTKNNNPYDPTMMKMMKKNDSAEGVVQQQQQQEQPPAPLSSEILSRVRYAMELSKQSATNITAAYEACDQWMILLPYQQYQQHQHQQSNNNNDDDDNDTSSFSLLVLDSYWNHIKRMCLALQASCLVRIGRDDEAVKVYTTALELFTIVSEQQQQQERHDLWIGKGYALQRLLRYEEAFETFQHVATVSERGVCSAATCLLRIGNMNKAKMILSDYVSSLSTSDSCFVKTNHHQQNQPQPQKDDDTRIISHTDQSMNAEGMLGTLELLLLSNYEENVKEISSSTSGAAVATATTTTTTVASKTQAFLHLKNAQHASILYRWIYYVLSSKQHQQESSVVFSVTTKNLNENDGDNDDDDRDFSFSFLDLIKINQSPFDDYDLIQLDDKVNLHRLLHRSATTKGVVTLGSNQDTSKVPSSSLLSFDKIIPSFWPFGLILPSQEDASQILQNLLTTEHQQQQRHRRLWFYKERSGYGSHGNTIVTTSQALSMATTSSSSAAELEEVGQDKERRRGEDEYLLQEMVQPALLLLDGRKFSIRVYVVMFGAGAGHSDSNGKSLNYENDNNNNDEIYLSSEGLVKMASMPVVVNTDVTTLDTNPPGDYNDDDEDKDGSTLDPRIHMTNSGRETNMIQKDLQYLQNEFNTRYGKGSYDELWQDIRQIVQVVLSAYQVDKKASATVASQRHLATTKITLNHQEEQTPKKPKRSNNGDPPPGHHQHQPLQLLDELGLPKILAFDLVVDVDRKPWLVEVNRFPGLEPRDAHDRRVKYRVVQDSWRWAMERMRSTTTTTLPESATTTTASNSRSLHPLAKILASLDDDHNDDESSASDMGRSSSSAVSSNSSLERIHLL